MRFSITNSLYEWILCGKNEGLISHYKGCGFKFLGINKLRNSSQLPAHYHNADVCFFEIKL